ncbi:hypothetical protein AB6F62_09970 [Providencia huaxiensis]
MAVHWWIWKKGICLPPEQRHIGYVFQDALFSIIGVKSNLRYGMSPVMKDRFDDIVELLGIGKITQSYHNSFSGGENKCYRTALLTAP